MGLPAEVVVTERLVTEQCCNCSVWFAMPSGLNERLRENGGLFYCPNGHSQHYTKSRVKMLEEQVSAEQRRTQAALARENELRAEKAKLERKLKRVDRGVCPQCNRTFSNLARHMACKHAEQPHDPARHAADQRNH
jgi:hypothetical protein